VWIANLYMSLFGRLRLGISHERLEIAVEQEAVEAVGPPSVPAIVSTIRRRR
jgi:hypothetical protein